jgi:hypothetical protein
LLASPGRVGKSSSYEAMCLYQRAALGYLAAFGAEALRALKTTASACEAE